MFPGLAEAVVGRIGVLAPALRIGVLADGDVFDPNPAPSASLRIEVQRGDCVASAPVGRVFQNEVEVAVHLYALDELDIQDYRGLVERALAGWGEAAGDGWQLSLRSAGEVPTSPGSAWHEGIVTISGDLFGYLERGSELPMARLLRVNGADHGRTTGEVVSGASEYPAIEDLEAEDVLGIVESHAGAYFVRTDGQQIDWSTGESAGARLYWQSGAIRTRSELVGGEPAVSVALALPDGAQVSIGEVFVP